MAEWSVRLRRPEQAGADLTWSTRTALVCGAALEARFDTRETTFEKTSFCPRRHASVRLAERFERRREAAGTFAQMPAHGSVAKMSR